jgi:hypothetical protein
LPEWLQAYALGPEIFGMLRKRNGFYAFESALHVFPLAEDQEIGLQGWNGDPLWRKQYEDLAEGLLFFAEDILQDQFCLSMKQDGVFRFHAETGQTVFIADSLERWAGLILSDYPGETGWSFVRQWQVKHGPLPDGKRLMPKIPFFLGGEYTIENLWAGDPVEGMRMKGNLATQTRHMLEGTQVRLKVDRNPKG